MIRLAGTVKRLNVEHRTSNIDDATLYLILKQANHRISKGRFARAMQALSPRVVQSFFKLTEFIIRCWTFNVRCSTFFSFFFDLTGRFLAGGGVFPELMYLDYCDIAENPFDTNNGKTSLWLGGSLPKVAATLKEAILDRKGIVCLTGDTGTGKSTIIKMITDILQDQFIIATLSDPGLSGLDFFNVLAVRFKFNKRFNSKSAFLIHLRNFLRNSHAINKNILLIIKKTINTAIVKECGIELGGKGTVESDVIPPPKFVVQKVKEKILTADQPPSPKRWLWIKAFFVLLFIFSSYVLYKSQTEKSSIWRTDEIVHKDYDFQKLREEESISPDT